MESTESITQHDTSAGSAQFINSYEYRGLKVAIWQDGDDFSAQVSGPPTLDLLHETEGAEHAGRVGLLAETWIRDNCAEPLEVGGWRILVVPDRGGCYQASVEPIDVAPDQVGPTCDEDFKGYIERSKCQDAAVTWAAKHPCFSSSTLPTEADDGASDEAEELVEDSAPEPAEPPAAPARVEAAPAPAATPASAPSHDPEAAATLSKYEQLRELAKREEELIREVNELAEDKKAIDAQIKAKTALIGVVRKEARDLSLGRVRGPQQTLPLTTTTTTSPAPTAAPAPFGLTPACADAAQETADKLKPVEERVVINSVEHTRITQTCGSGSWESYLKGHKQDTEGYGETRAQAIEASDVRISVWSADHEPGTTTPSTDAGPVADGPRPPAKKSKARKLAGKTAEKVLTALREAMTGRDAAETIGCTEGELEEWLRLRGEGLSDHLGRDAGKDEPAPARAKASSKKKAAKKVAKAGGRGWGK